MIFIFKRVLLIIGCQPIWATTALAAKLQAPLLLFLIFLLKVRPVEVIEVLLTLVEPIFTIPAEMSFIFIG